MKAIIKPLVSPTPAPAGQYKPMKVEKSKKKRVHKVKQGAPPKLSASQKRKLVRLYLLTCLSWDNILKLVLHFGLKTVRKRAVQTILEGLLGTRYKDLRPRNADARRKRRSQIQRCRELSLVQKRRQQKAGPSSQPTKANLDLAIKSDFDCHDQSSLDLEPIFFDSAKGFDQVETQISDFDIVIDSKANEDLDRDVPDQKPMLFPGINGADDDFPFFPMERMTDAPLPFTSQATDPFFPCTGPLGPSMVEESLQNVSLPMLEPFSLSTYKEEHPVEMDLQQQNEPLVPFDNGYEFEASHLTGSDASNTDAALESSLTTSLTVRRLPLDNSQPAMTTQKSHLSNLSSQVDRLSKCSLGEKTFIKNCLEHFSASTLSSVNSSTLSRLSAFPGQAVQSSKIGVPTRPTLGISRRKRSNSFDLPGDYITSDVNIFSEHIACPAEHRISSHPIYFEGCCLRYVSLQDEAKYCVPSTVVQFKRGLPMEKNWSSRGLWWVDRFGNTALHIAAALGFNYQQLRKIIDEGINVHELNSARQTFLHVLHARFLTLEDMTSLRNDLEQRAFNFHQIDVQGRTFIHSFESCGLHPLVFARCWLETLVMKDRSVGGVINYRFVKKIFERNGGSKNEWDELGWFESYYSDNKAVYSTPDMDASSVVYKLMDLQHYEFLYFVRAEDYKGRNLLHFAADVISESADPRHSKENDDGFFRSTRFKLVKRFLAAERISEPADPRHSKENDDGFFSFTRFKLVKKLLDNGVEINHHDESGETPLMAHVRSLPHRPEIVEMLLQSGADTDSRNKNGETPAHISIRLGNIETTKALLKQGANVHARDKKGRGLLAVAESAQRHARKNEGLYARITACMALAIDAGAITSPNLFQEWDLSEQTRTQRES